MQIFELNQIDYDQPIEQRLAARTAGGRELGQGPEKLPDNEKYASMTPEEAARAFFEACGREDWDEAGKFWTNPLDEGIRQFLGGLAATSAPPLVPKAMIRAAALFFMNTKPGQGQVHKHNLALKKDQKTGRWFVDGGI